MRSRTEWGQGQGLLDGWGQTRTNELHNGEGEGRRRGGGRGGRLLEERGEEKQQGLLHALEQLCARLSLRGVEPGLG